MSLSDEFEKIPCKILMLCYDKDCKEFRPQITDVLLDNFFSASLPTKERCLHWISAFSLFEPLHRKAINNILSQKRRLRHEMQNYLHLRNSKEVKDDLLRKAEDRNPHSEFLQLLSTKCSLNISSSQHINCLLDYLSSQKPGNKHLEDSSVQLLLSIINAFPSLLRGFEKWILLLLSNDIIPFNEQLMHVLAREGPNSSIKLCDIYSSLENICLEGTRGQAKIAVSVVAAFNVSSEKFIFSNLCKRLVDSLHARLSIPTVLQSLGCMAQHCSLTTEAHEIACYILEEIFQVTHVEMPNEQDVFNKTPKCISLYKWVIYALKALVRSFLPHQRIDANRRIDCLLDVILELLQKRSFSDTSVLW